MPRYHRRRRKPVSDKQWVGLLCIIFAIGIGVLSLQVAVILRQLSGEMAISDAKDSVTDTVNEAMLIMMTHGTYDYEYFVDLGVGTDGQVASLNANMSRINAFAAALLDYVGQLDRKNVQVKIPIGNLTGSSLLLGRGPEVTVHVIMLTSPSVKFRSELSSGGINQTEHRLILDVVVDIDVLVPWGSMATQTVTEVLIAQTVIVGRVPNLYMNTSE